MNSFLSYDQTNVLWIGEIPTNWSTKRLKHIFSEKKSTKNPDLSSGSISFGKIIYKDDEKILESTKDSYQEVLDGEFLINPLNLNYDLKSLRIGLSKINVVVSQGYIVLRINDGFVPQYYEYLMRKFDVEHMKSLGQGVRQTISFTHIKDEELVVPPVEEQKLISRYLDKKTEQIDRLIEKIQKKIKLLKEQRTSLINQCVTKGLDPNVEMKDSGVEWIGEIPKHWVTISLKYCSEILRGKFSHRPRNDPDFYDGEYPFIQTGDITRSGKFITDFTQSLNEKGYAVSKQFPINTLVMGISANIGNVSILKIPSCFPDSIVGFYPGSCWSTDFLYYLFTSMKEEFERNSIVSTQLNLNVDRLEDIQIPNVPLPEQEEIYRCLDEKQIENEKLLEAHLKKCELLSEYRQSLISSVVTGKIRVTEDMV